MNYIVGIGFVDRVDLLHRAVQSIQPYWPRTLVIDNSPEQLLRNEEALPVNVFEPPVPLSFSQTLNLLFRQAAERGAEFVLFMQHDAEAQPGAAQAMLNHIAFWKAQSRQWGAALTHNHTLVAFRMEAVKAIGPLDTFFPRYFADTDYFRRMKLAGYEIVETQLPVTQLEGGTTVHSDPYLEMVSFTTYPYYENYYASKWGGPHFQESFSVPFNREDLHTKYAITLPEAPFYKKGLNVIGYVRAEMGIGESCRSLARSLGTTSVPFGVIDYPETTFRMNDLSCVHLEMSEPRYDTNLFVMNADTLCRAREYYGKSLFQGRYNIGLWAWELMEFPDEYCEGFRHVQEVWVPSTFILDAVSRKAKVPVIRMPLGISVPPALPNRSAFGLPGKAFLFLCAYDVHSLQERKNPQAAIQAFKLAFAKNDTSVGLVIKISNAQDDPAQIERLKELCSGYTNIYFIEGLLERGSVYSLLRSVDAVVSLHRSEGFGLMLAEAMYLGIPVIATDWSGNTDFMTRSNSCPVDYKLVPIGRDIGPFKAHQLWAEADVLHAVSYMLKLTENRDWARKLGSEGKRTIHEQYSLRSVGARIASRLQLLQNAAGR